MLYLCFCLFIFLFLFHSCSHPICVFILPTCLLHIIFLFLFPATSTSVLFGGSRCEESPHHTWEKKKKNWRWNCWGVQRPPLRSKTNIDWTFFETFTVPNNRPRMYDVLSRRFVLPKLGTFNIYLRHFESFFTHVSKCVPRIPSPPQNIKFYNLGIQSCQNICSPLIKTLHICYWPWHLGYFGYSIWKKHNSLKIFNLDSM
jgi:hypothetical protein